MLQTLRDRFPRWLFFVTLGLLVLLLAFVSLYSFQSNINPSNATVIRVNGEPIQQKALDASYDRLKQQQQIQLGADFQMTPGLEKQLRAQALKQLVLTEVLSQHAKHQGYTLKEIDIAMALGQIPLFQKEGKFSQTRFREIIEAASLTESDFIKSLKKSMLINQIRTGLLQSAFVLPSEINTAIRLVHQQRNFNYLIVPANHFNTRRLSTSIQEELAYYRQNTDQFRTPEQVSISYIMLSLQSLIQKLRAGHPELNALEIRQRGKKAFLEATDNLARLTYMQPLSLTSATQSLHLPIQSTTLFSRAGGQDPISQHPKIIKAAFSSDTLQGNNSPIIHLSPEKLLVLRVKHHQPASLQPFEAVRDSIQTQLKIKKAQQKAMEWGEHLIKELRQIPIEAHKSVQHLFSWHSSKHVTRYGTQAPSAIVDTAFRMPRPQKEEIPVTGFCLPNGDYAIVCLLTVQDGKPHQVKPDQRAIYQEELKTERGQFDYTLYTREAFRRAKIK